MKPQAVPRLDPKTTDEELARRVAAGEESAARLLMRRYNQTLFRTARSILRDDAEAEDALQEAYLKAFRAIGGFKGDSRLSTWLVRIVVNEALGRLRKSKRGAEVIAIDSQTEIDIETRLDMASGDPQAQPDREAERSEARAIMELKIDELPDAFRTVFMLRAVEEMTVEETAAALGIPEATVRTRFFRARALLRESLARSLDVATESAFSFAGERCDRIVERVAARLHEVFPRDG
jgi:RNA polymerase sigma-70 factor (ECF subfamily)